MSRPDDARHTSDLRGLARFRVWALALAVLLAAVSAGAPAPALAGPTGYEITCYSASDCDRRLDPVAMPGGGAFAFEFGVEVLDDGLVLDVTTPGSIYVRGDLVTHGGTIELMADSIDVVYGTNIGNQTGPITPPVIDPGIPPIVPGTRPGHGGVIICACVTVVSLPQLPDPPTLELASGGGIELRARDLAVLEGLAFPPPQPKAPGDAKGGAILIDRDGDIHIDTSHVGWFERIDLAAGEKLVVDGGDGKKVPVVPEPGTATLLGIGLAALAGRRRKGHRTR